MTAGALMSVFWVVLALLGALCALAFIQGLGRALPVVALGFVLAMAPDVSHAQAVSASKVVDQLSSSSGGPGRTTVNSSNVGSPLQLQETPTAANDGASSARINQSGNLKNPSGNNVKVNTVGRVGGGVIANKIARALPVIGAVITAVEIYDLLNEMNWRQGEAGLEKKDPAICTVAPCNEYRYFFDGVSTGYVAKNTDAGLCGQLGSSSTTFNYRNCSFNPNATTSFGATGNYSFERQLKAGGAWTLTGASVDQRTVAPAPSQYKPATIADLEAEIASKSGWPSNSNMARAGVRAAEILGEKYQPQIQSITGPAQTPGPAPKVEEKVNPDGSKQVTTTTTVHNHNYAGNTVNTTNVTTTVINNINPQGQTTDTTTRTETEEPEATEDPPTPPTWAPTTAPEVPKLYERKYPEGLVGVWNSRKAELSAGPLSTLASQLMPSVLPVGQCPAWNIELNLGAVSAYAAGWNFGTYNVAPACSLWQVAAAIVIVGALILARALVFGG